MILFATTQQIWIVYAIATLLGALGGIIADLLLRGKAGQLEKPRTLQRYWDLGFFAELLVGAAAAVAFLWFLSVGATQVEGKDVSAYDVRILVGASLVVGTAGGSIIAAMAERATALVTQEKAKTAVTEAIRELQHQESLTRLAGVDTSTLDAALGRLTEIERQIDPNSDSIER